MKTIGALSQFLEQKIGENRAVFHCIGITPLKFSLKRQQLGKNSREHAVNIPVVDVGK